MRTLIACDKRLVCTFASSRLCSLCFGVGTEPPTSISAFVRISTFLRAANYRVFSVVPQAANCAMPSVIFEDPSVAEKPLSDSGFTLGWTLRALYDNSEEFREALGSGKVKKVRVAGWRIYGTF